MKYAPGPVESTGAIYHRRDLSGRLPIISQDVSRFETVSIYFDDEQLLVAEQLLFFTEQLAPAAQPFAEDGQLVADGLPAFEAEQHAAAEFTVGAIVAEILQQPGEPL